MKRIIPFWIFLLTALSSYEQTNPEIIYIKRGFGPSFIRNEERLTYREVVDIIKTNKEAYRQIKIARTYFAIGSILAYPSAFVLGWSTTDAIISKNPNWILTGICVGLIVVSIPFSVGYDSHTKKAVIIYDQGLESTGYNDIDLKLGLTSDGIGLKLVF